jgi:peptidoglycan/LPS O-acetylase OafA/YrhL
VTKNKDLALEGLRGLACLAVAIGHFTYIFFPYLSNDFRPIPGIQPAYRIERVLEYPPFSLAFGADAAVSIFFVLSGYVLTTKYFRNYDTISLQGAAAKRYVRLVLPCFVSVMFSWIIWRVGLTFSKDALAIHVAGWVPTVYAGNFPLLDAIFQGLIAGPFFGIFTLNWPLWSIQVELIGSLLLFGMVAALGRHPFWLVVWFLFFASVLGYQGIGTLYYISFGAGAMLNLARGWLRRNEQISLILAVLGVIGVAFNHFYLYRAIQAIPLPNLAPFGPNFANGALEMTEAWWHTIGAILLVAGAIGSRQVATVFATRLPVFLGKVSFAVYILHWPILMSVALGAAWAAQRVGIAFGFSALIACIIYLAVVFALATLFERYVDRPSIKLADLIGARATLPRDANAELVPDNRAGL